MKVLKQLLMISLVSTALFACSDDDNNPVTAGGATNGPTLVEKLYVAVADTGTVKSIHLMEEAGSAKGSLSRHASAPTLVTSSITMAGTIFSPGELIASEGNVYVRLNSTDDAVSTQIQMFDVASDGLDHNHPIEVGQRPIHLYKDADEKIWVMNDGPGDNKSGADSASVIVGGMHAEEARISTGSGHHKAAFATKSKRVFVSNIHDSTLSVIDNDPASASYLTNILPDGNNPHSQAVAVGENPHGIDYSPHNGMVYNLNTRDAVNAISVINENTLAQTFITKGDAADQVPAVGRIHTRHQHDNPSDGRFLYILANTESDNGTPDDASDDTTTGWVIVIDSMNTGVNNGIIAKTQIPHMRPARIVFGPHGKRLYIPSGVPFGGGAGTPDLETNQLAVIDIDPTSPTFNQLLKKIQVGNAAGHGSIAVTTGDGHFLFVGNGGETTVSVIDAEALAVVGIIDVGGSPSGILVVPVGANADGGHAHG